MTTLPETKLTVAAVQMCSTGDVRVNLDRARALVESAASAGARLVVLPENFGFLDREGEKLRHIQSIEDGQMTRWSRQAARENGIYLAAGTVPLASEDGRVFNTTLMWDPSGTLVARYDKIHLFDIHLDSRHDFMESRYVAPGQAPVTVDVDGWRIGLTVCYDLRFPELYRRLVRLGAHAVLVPSAFTAATGQDHWDLLVRARAVENQCYVVAAAQWGKHNERRASFGASCLVDPWGDVLARRATGEGVVTATFDPVRLADIRSRLPALSHRRTDLFGD